MRHALLLPFAYLLGFWCCYLWQPAGHDAAPAPARGLTSAAHARSGPLPCHGVSETDSPPGGLTKIGRGIQIEKLFVKVRSGVLAA